MSKPVVAIVGRPNVGKSTLFNALAGEKISIVKDTPGVTRDRIYADIDWLNYKFTLIDTGGMEPDTEDIILRQILVQAQIAIDTADVIIFVTDVKQGVTEADSQVANMLRRTKKPVVLAVNKVDDMRKENLDVYEFYSLGIGEVYPISAGQALGLGDMLDAVCSVVSIPVIASGGAGCKEDFVKLFKTLPKVDAGLAASIFHFGEVDIRDLKKTLKNEGINMRI